MHNITTTLFASCTYYRVLIRLVCMKTMFCKVCVKSPVKLNYIHLVAFVAWFLQWKLCASLMLFSRSRVYWIEQAKWIFSGKLSRRLEMNRKSNPARIFVYISIYNFGVLASKEHNFVFVLGRWFNCVSEQNIHDWFNEESTVNTEECKILHSEAQAHPPHTRRWSEIPHGI